MERAAASAVAGLDAAGSWRSVARSEITAVESYQRVVALLTALGRRGRAVPYRLALHLEMLGILRDERVHRDVFHVLHRAFGGERMRRAANTARGRRSCPTSLVMRPITRPAELSAVCRAILAFHYGAALPSGAPPEVAMRTAVDYWRWHMDDPRRKSYLVDRQRQDIFDARHGMLLLGTAGLEAVVRGMPVVRLYHLEQGAIPWFMSEGEALLGAPPLPTPRRPTRSRLTLVRGSRRAGAA